MKLIIPVISIALLSACAMPYEEQRAHAANSSNDYLCMKIATRPEHRQAAEDELRARGASCDWGKVQAMIAGQQQALPRYNPYYLPQPALIQPQLDPVPRTIQCTSMPMGGGWSHTECR